MNRFEKFLARPLVAIILAPLIIGCIVAIFQVIFQSSNHVPDTLNVTETPVSQTVYPPTALGPSVTDTILSTSQGMTPLPSETPFVRPTSAPTWTPQSIPFDNPTSKIVEIVSGGYTGVDVRVTGGNSPIIGQELLVISATESISGEWSYGSGTHGTTITTDASGFAAADLPMGNYILSVPSPGAYYDKMRGQWGVIGLGWFGNPTEIVPFTVKAGRRVVISISLAKLEIGVLDSKGRARTGGYAVWFFCQGTDIAGNVTALNETVGCYPALLAKTDERGIATIFLAAGTYFATGDSLSFQDGSRLLNIVLAPGESRQELLRINNIDQYATNGKTG